MKKTIAICSLGIVAIAVTAFLFVNTQYGRTVIGVYQINAGLSKPALKAPPIGRWHAVYTAEFAEKHNLPPENITTNLSEGIAYMEMETLPRMVRQPHTMCMVNMLVQKPHDISMTIKDGLLPNILGDRKLLHLINIQSYKDQLKPISSIYASSYDFKPEKRGFEGSTYAVYAENVLKYYDYFSASYGCKRIPLHHNYYPDGYGFRINKASVWGKYERKYSYIDQPGRPKGEDYYNSKFFIRIPEKIILNIFEI